jgi:ATP-dependent DNA helicase RecG
MATKPKFVPRKLMEMAVDVMKQSVHEPREDGKYGPLVGAVLFKPDGTIETACRGELRHGDHAEYTLLERKNRDSRLDGSSLFATLEPCAPGARNSPKLSCAERIVLARISDVWVGIEDPDPTVDRKGIKYLQDNDVTVHMFDRDLQEIIHDENKAFIAQALERADELEKGPKPVILSRFEDPILTTEIKDFSLDALAAYRSGANISAEINSGIFNRRLLQQGLLMEVGGKFTPTGFGLLLFGKEPRIVIPQAGLLGTILYPDGSEETRDFDGPLVLIPSLVENWLRDKLPNVIDRSQMRRQQISVLPFELVREAVVNALIHRDYDVAGGKCQIVVSEDTITIKSPGGPLTPITLEQLQTFNAPMLSRNPGLHYVFARMELAEERGLGLKSLKSRPMELGLPLPKYTFENPYLILTLYRYPESATRVLAPDILQSMSEDEKQSWQFIVTKDSVTSFQLMEQLGYDERKSQRVLKRLIESGFIRRVGKGPATRYEAVSR